MRFMIFILAFLLFFQASAHETNGVACNGGELKENVIERAGLTESERKEVMKITLTDDIFVKESLEIIGFTDSFSQQFDKWKGSEYAKEIAWGDAKRLILMGKVTDITQAHNLNISLRTRAGNVYRTIEPSIDEVFKISGIVDPCHIFIRIATE